MSFFEKTDSKKVVFILGHQRSSTTNMHKALSSPIDLTQTGTFFDLVFPSLILKYCFGPLIGLVDRIFFKSLIRGDEVPNFKFGVNEELEKYTLLMHFGASEVTDAYLFPYLSLESQYYKQALKIEPKHLQFVKKCIARTLNHKNTQQKCYVGCPLGLSREP